jgi:hypothetical protein
VKKTFLLVFLLFSVFSQMGKTEGASSLYRAIPKDAYPVADTIMTGVPPNVLFLLDTGSSMTFTPTGILPDVNDGRSVQTRINLVKAGSTYGGGGRPFSVNGAEQELTTYSRYGRDVNQSNNKIGDPYCYYSPYPNKPYFLTFKNSTWANYVGTGIPSGMEEAIRKYMPGSGKPEAGKPVPTNVANQYLVPNDSRMYQMKLALWRVLGAENAGTFAGMRVGMATSYREENYPNTAYRADFYYADPTGGWTADTLYAPGFVGIGQNDSGTRAFVGIDRVNYDYNHSYPQWAQVNRANLVVPFDYIYKQKTGGDGTITYVSTENLARIQEYIDGIENGNGTVFTNRDLYADGKTPLATSIYSRHIMTNRVDTKNNPIVRYAPQFVANGYGQGKIDYVTYGVHIPLRSFPVSADLLPGAKTIRAGQAVGSVIDFFSPASSLPFNDNVSTPPSNDTADTVGYFPVLGGCQSNWLIVFTAANDSDSGFSAAEAVTMLFKNSRTMRGRYWNGTKWVTKDHDMDSGIRTMVVGMVDPNSPDPLVNNLRDSLHNAAKDGDPKPNNLTTDKDGHGPGFERNPDASAYFATDVAQLVASLNAILTRITSGTFAAGSPSIVPQGDDETGNVVFSATYTVNNYNQWEARLTKSVVSTDMSMPTVWEFNSQKLVPTLGTRASRVYTTESPKGDSGTGSVLVNTLQDSEMTALTGATNHIAEFKNWLIRYNNTNILGDSEHSNLQIVRSPDITELQNISNVNNRPPRVYIQTNRGVLHAIDYHDGGEQWAFFPPNVFQTRLKAMKFDQNIAGEPWYDGDGVNVMASEPLNTLDGLLSKGDVITSSGPKTILIGNMGLGGNGLYAMDVTNPNDNGGKPTFLWAVENSRYTGGPSTEVGLWGKSAASANITPYDKLGLTVVAATFLKAPVSSGDERNVVFLPGGLGYNLGADDQGKIFYVLLPEDGNIVKTFTESAGFEGPMTARLGMGVAPTTTIAANERRNSIKNQAFFTGDSEGNVLYCNTSDDVSGWTLKSIFQLRDLIESKPVVIPNAIGVGRASDNDLWLFCGSGPLDAPDPDPGTGLPRGILNVQNYIFAFNQTKTENFTEVTLADLTPLKYAKDNHPSLPDYGVTLAPDDNKLVPQNINGWYLALRPSQSMIDSGTTVGTRPEYVTTPPYLYNGVLYVTTFIPRVRGTDEYEVCPDLGHSKFYAIDPLSGKGKWKGDGQALVLTDIKVTGIASAGGRLFFGIQALSGTALDALQATMGNQDVELHISPDGSMFSIRGLSDPPVESTLSPEQPYIQYWRDIYNP